MSRIRSSSLATNEEWGHPPRCSAAFCALGRALLRNLHSEELSSHLRRVCGPGHDVRVPAITVSVPSTAGNVARNSRGIRRLYGHEGVGRASATVAMATTGSKRAGQLVACSGPGPLDGGVKEPGHHHWHPGSISAAAGGSRLLLLLLHVRFHRLNRGFLALRLDHLAEFVHFRFLNAMSKGHVAALQLLNSPTLGGYGNLSSLPWSLRSRRCGLCLCCWHTLRSLPAAHRYVRHIP